MIPPWAFGVSLAVGACGWALYWREVVRHVGKPVTIKIGEGFVSSPEDVDEAMARLPLPPPKDHGPRS